MKNSGKLDTIKFLKMKLLWDYNIIMDKEPILNKFQDHLDFISKLKLHENNSTMLIEIVNKINKAKIPFLFKESLLEFLLDEIWSNYTLTELKESQLDNKISKIILFFKIKIFFRKF